MRKFLAAAATLVAIVAVALLARPKTREEAPLVTRAPEAAAPSISDTALAPAPPAIPGPAPETSVQPVSRNISTPSERPASPARPVSPVPAPMDEEADAQDGAAILKRASAAYARVRSMRADFVQMRENPLLESELTSRGTLCQRNPDRFALKFTQPAGDVIVGDGKYFWVYYPSADKRQVIRADATPGAAGAVDLKAQFIGDPVRKFSYTYFGPQRDAGRNVHVLNLTPREKSGYKSLRVWIDATDYLVRRFRIVEETGAIVEFQLSNLMINPTLGDEIFRFTPPAGAQVIER